MLADALAAWCQGSEAHLDLLFRTALILQCLERRRCAIGLGKRWLHHRAGPHAQRQHHIDLGGVDWPAPPSRSRRPGRTVAVKMIAQQRD
jgi:hypothetical protein